LPGEPKKNEVRSSELPRTREEKKNTQELKRKGGGGLRGPGTIEVFH